MLKFLELSCHTFTFEKEKQHVGAFYDKREDPG